MADCDQTSHKPSSHEEAATVETQDRGMFDFLKKNDGDKKAQEEAAAISSEFEHKVHVTEPVHVHKVEEHEHKKPVEEKEEEKKHDSLLQKLTRSDSSSSSSSEEEVEEGGEKKKKKLKDKVKGKLTGEHKEEEVKKHEDTSIPVEKVDEPEEKKGFMDKIKDKLPGGGKKTEVVAVPPPPVPVAEAVTHDGDSPKEKKGILEKIKEKLPGYHPKSDEEKEKEKEGAHH